MKRSEAHTRAVVDGMAWLIAEGCHEDVPLALREGWNHGRLLRATPHRRVLQVQGSRGFLLVKHFLCPGLVGAGKRMLRGAPAATEWDALSEARRRGLPVPRPLALGKRPSGTRDSLLVTEFIADARPLSEYLFGCNRAAGSTRQLALRQAARLIRRAHDAGFYQSDLHTDNILVRPGGDTLDLFLIDLQRVSFSRGLSRRKRWRNLSVLNGGCTEAGLTDRVRFLKSYLSGGPPLNDEFRKLIARLERAGQKHRLRLWRSRAKRCVAENREFLKIRMGEFCGFALRDAWTPEFKDALDGPCQNLFHGGVERVAQSFVPTGRLFSLSQGTFHITRYRSETISGRLKNLFGSCEARRIWVARHRMRMRGIAVTLPIAYLERRRFRVFRESYLIAQGVEGEKLCDILGRSAASNRVVPEKRSLIESMARLLRTVHASGMFGLDLKGSNIIVQTDTPEKFRLFLDDPAGARAGRVSWRRRVDDIAATARNHPAMSRSDRLRFLKAYLGLRERDKWKRLWRDVAKFDLRRAPVRTLSVAE